MSGPRVVQVAPERLERWLAGFGERHGGALAQADGAQVVLSGSDGALARCRVPFGSLEPVPQDRWLGLTQHAARPWRFAVLLVRRGGYAAGVFAGAEPVRSKVGSRYVQGRTAAGGQSQQRFARRRDNQAAALVSAAADVAVRVLLPEAPSLAALVPGGDRRLVTAVLDDVRLAALAALPRGDWLAVADPRLDVLRAAAEAARAVRITLIDP